MIVWDVLSSLGLMNKVSSSKEDHRAEANNTPVACQTSFPRTVRILTLDQRWTNMADQAPVTMPERPRMATEPDTPSSTNGSRLLHMLKNDRVAVL
jgi:hypothetical protein